MYGPNSHAACQVHSEYAGRDAKDLNQGSVGRRMAGAAITLKGVVSVVELGMF